MGDERQKPGDNVGPIRTGTKLFTLFFDFGKSNPISSRRLRVVDFDQCTLFGRGKSTCRVLVCHRRHLSYF